MAKIKTRRYYIYYLLKMLFFVVSLIPLNISLFLANFLGKAAFWCVPKYRERTISNLDMVLGGSHSENVKIAEKVFINLAKNGAEWIKLYSADPKKLGLIITEDSGMEYLDEVLASGNGALVLGFHFGNWEFTGFYLRYKDYPGSLVARRIYFHKYDKFLSRLRKKFDAPTIYRDESPRKMLKELKRGHILGIVPDQNVDSIEGVYVDFFGRKAFTPTAPVKLAMVAKTKLVPVFVVRKKDNTHKFIIEKPIDPVSTGDAEEDVKRYTQEWTSLLERYVRKYPDHWVWMHERWKSQPKEEKKEALQK